MASRLNVRPALGDLTARRNNAENAGVVDPKMLRASGRTAEVDKENVVPRAEKTRHAGSGAVKCSRQQRQLPSNKPGLATRSSVTHRPRQPLQATATTRLAPSRKGAARGNGGHKAPTTAGFTIFSDELPESSGPKEEQPSPLHDWAKDEAEERSDDLSEAMEVAADLTLDAVPDDYMEDVDDQEDDDDELADDIYRFLRGAEMRHLCKWNYMSKQPDITFSMRSVLVDWLIEVAEEYKMHSETIFLAVNYIDRFLSHMSVERAKLQLVGTACIFIASKYEEIYPPDVSEFIYITDDTYTKKQLLKMEALVLNVLNFKMAAPTVLQFLDQFAVATQCDSETRSLSLYLSELSLVDGERFLSYRPSVVAAGSVALARHTLGHPAWPEFAAETFSIAVDDFKECLVNLHHAFTNAPSASQQAVREKYKQQKYQAVALLKPTPIYQ